jgi:hypothetical protein
MWPIMLYELSAMVTNTSKVGHINKEIVMRFLCVIVLMIALSGCDNRKCLASHKETQCACSCVNNIPVTSPYEYEKCDIYENKK